MSEPQSTPPSQRPYKNGVDHRAEPRSRFAPRSWSFLWRAKVEALVAFGVIALVGGIFVYLVQIPGALIVRVLDDGKRGVPRSLVRCRHPATQLEMVGETDVFGEAKFPGLERGAWTCQVQPPDRFFSPPLTGSVDVQPRHPGVLEVYAQRAVDVGVSIARPSAAPYGALAVGAVCPPEGNQPAQGWEARTALLDATVIMYLPPGRKCRIGLLPGSAGQVYFAPERTRLDCANMPCSEVLQGKAGEHLSLKLTPTRAQWESARPPPEPDPGAK